MKTKNLFAMAAAIVVASGLAACSGEALVNDTPQEEAQKKVMLSVTATQGERKQGTRMNYEEAPNATTGTVGMTLTWEADDLLGVEPANDADVISSSEYLTGAPEDADKSTMNFTGSVRENTKDGTYFFYYPAQDMSGPSFEANDPGVLVLSLDNQSNTLDANGVASTEDLWKYNLLYTPKAVDPSKGGITLTHACALLRFVLKLPADAPVMNKLYISTWEQKLPYPAVELLFNFGSDDAAGARALGTTNTLSLSLSGDQQSNVERTITAYMMVPAVSDFSGLLCKVSLVNSTSGATYSYVYNLTKTTASAANGNFKGGTVYTFEPSAALQEDKWAGSNIYWDEANLELTFEQNPHEMGKSAAQGLYFKWGSLMGRAATVGSFVANSTPVYTLEGETTKSAWSDLTYDGTTASGELDPANDICTQVGGTGWRMPKESESTLSGPVTLSVTTLPEEYKADGTTAIKQGKLYNGLFYVPLGGYAGVSNGNVTVSNMGASGGFWSSTAASSSMAYFWEGSINMKLSEQKTAAFPIRCIKAN